MTGGFWGKIDQAGRNIAPLAVTVALMLVGMAPLHLPNYAAIAPALPLMALYYWVIHRPDLLRPSLAFGLGLLQDLLSGTPLGMTPMIYVLVYWGVLTQRRFFLGTSFAMLWFGFTLIAFGAAFVGWLAYSILNLRLLSPDPALMQAVMTVVLFPRSAGCSCASTGPFSSTDGKSCAMVERDTDRYRSLTRRALMLGGIQAGLLSTLVGRMYYLQVLQSDRYTMLAEENRINMRLLAPSRGQILDRFGVPLAVNQQNFRVVMVYEQARKIDRMLNLISEIVPLTDADFRRITREIQRKRAFVPVTVKENLTWEQVTMIEVNAPDLPGVSIDVGELRNYPYEAATSHLLGYVGVVSESELNGDPVLTLPGFRIGKAGVEKFHDTNLRGVAGTSQLEVNSVGRVIRELSRDEGQSGRDVTLTIDIGLQQYTQDRLGDEKSAAAVVMDVHTGGIYAMASNPSYDSNLFTTGINAETWEELLSDPTTPLTNKVVAGQYAPGSTFKMMVALAALDSGIVGPRHTVYVPRLHGSGRPPLPLLEEGRAWHGRLRRRASSTPAIPSSTIWRSGSASTASTTWRSASGWASGCNSTSPASGPA